MNSILIEILNNVFSQKNEDRENSRKKLEKLERDSYFYIELFSLVCNKQVSLDIKLLAAALLRRKLLINWKNVVLKEHKKSIVESYIKIFRVVDRKLYPLLLEILVELSQDEENKIYDYIVSEIYKHMSMIIHNVVKMNNNLKLVESFGEIEVYAKILLCFSKSFIKKCNEKLETLFVQFFTLFMQFFSFFCIKIDENVALLCKIVHNTHEIEVIMSLSKFICTNISNCSIQVVIKELLFNDNLKNLLGYMNTCIECTIDLPVTFTTLEFMKKTCKTILGVIQKVFYMSNDMKKVNISFEDKKEKERKIIETTHKKICFHYIQKIFHSFVSRYIVNKDSIPEEVFHIIIKIVEVALSLKEDWRIAFGSQVGFLISKIILPNMFMTKEKFKMHEMDPIEYCKLYCFKNPYYFAENTEHVLRSLYIKILKVFPELVVPNFEAMFTNLDQIFQNLTWEQYYGILNFIDCSFPILPFLEKKTKFGEIVQKLRIIEIFNSDVHTKKMMVPNFIFSLVFKIMIKVMKLDRSLQIQNLYEKMFEILSCETPMVITQNIDYTILENKVFSCPIGQMCSIPQKIEFFYLFGAITRKYSKFKIERSLFEKHSFAKFMLNFFEITTHFEIVELFSSLENVIEKFVVLFVDFSFELFNVMLEFFAKNHKKIGPSTSDRFEISDQKDMTKKHYFIICERSLNMMYALVLKIISLKKKETNLNILIQISKMNDAFLHFMNSLDHDAYCSFGNLLLMIINLFLKKSLPEELDAVKHINLLYKFFSMMEKTNHLFEEILSCIYNIIEHFSTYAINYNQGEPLKAVFHEALKYINVKYNSNIMIESHKLLHILLLKIYDKTEFLIPDLYEKYLKVFVTYFENHYNNSDELLNIFFLTSLASFWFCNPELFSRFNEQSIAKFINFFSEFINNHDIGISFPIKLFILTFGKLLLIFIKNEDYMNHCLNLINIVCKLIKKDDIDDDQTTKSSSEKFNTQFFEKYSERYIDLINESDDEEYMVEHMNFQKEIAYDSFYTLPIDQYDEIDYFKACILQIDVLYLKKLVSNLSETNRIILKKTFNVK